jgi:hypothetical protein
MESAGIRETDPVNYPIGENWFHGRRAQQVANGFGFLEAMRR